MKVSYNLSDGKPFICASLSFFLASRPDYSPPPEEDFPPFFFTTLSLHCDSLEYVRVSSARVPYDARFSSSFSPCMFISLPRIQGGDISGPLS